MSALASLTTEAAAVAAAVVVSVVAGVDVFEAVEAVGSFHLKLRLRIEEACGSTVGHPLADVVVDNGAFFLKHLSAEVFVSFKFSLA